MALKQYWLGSEGPYLYYDTDVYQDDAALSLHGARFEGQILVGTAPTVDDHVVRLQDLGAYISVVQVTDIDDPSTELASLSTAVEGGMLVAYEVADPNEYTIYCWDASASAANVPYVVAGDSGYWVAVAGTKIMQGLPAGSDGDIIRFNGTSEKWETDFLPDFDQDGNDVRMNLNDGEIFKVRINEVETVSIGRGTTDDTIYYIGLKRSSSMRYITINEELNFLRVIASIP